MTTFWDATMEAELAANRADAESRMTSTCTVYRKTGEYITQADGRQVPEWIVVHTGKVRVRGASSGATQRRTANLPGGDQVRGTPELHYPIAAFVPADGDLAQIDTGDRAGTVWALTNDDGGDQQTALRLPAERTDRPEEWD